MQHKCGSTLSIVHGLEFSPAQISGDIFFRFCFCDRVKKHAKLLIKLISTDDRSDMGIFRVLVGLEASNNSNKPGGFVPLSPNDTLRSLLPKLNVLCEREILRLSYIDSEKDQVSCESECEFQELLKVVSERSREGSPTILEIEVGGKLPFSSRKSIRLMKTIFKYVDQGLFTSKVMKKPHCVETTNGSVNETSSSAINHDSELLGSTSLRSEHPPPWFGIYMEKFKNDLMVEIKGVMQSMVKHSQDVGSKISNGNNDSYEKHQCGNPAEVVNHNKQIESEHNYATNDFVTFGGKQSQSETINDDEDDCKIFTFGVRKDDGLSSMNGNAKAEKKRVSFKEKCGNGYCDHCLFDMDNLCISSERISITESDSDNEQSSEDYTVVPLPACFNGLIAGGGKSDVSKRIRVSQKKYKEAENKEFQSFDDMLQLKGHRECCGHDYRLRSICNSNKFYGKNQDHQELVLEAEVPQVTSSQDKSLVVLPNTKFASDERSSEKCISDLAAGARGNVHEGQGVLNCETDGGRSENLLKKGVHKEELVGTSPIQASSTSGHNIRPNPTSVPRSCPPSETMAGSHSLPRDSHSRNSHEYVNAKPMIVHNRPIPTAVTSSHLLHQQRSTCSFYQAPPQMHPYNSQPAMQQYHPNQYHSNMFNLGAAWRMPRFHNSFGGHVVPHGPHPYFPYQTLSSLAEESSMSRPPQQLQHPMRQYGSRTCHQQMPFQTHHLVPVETPHQYFMHPNPPNHHYHYEHQYMPFQHPATSAHAHSQHMHKAQSTHLVNNNGEYGPRKPDTQPDRYIPKRALGTEIKHQSERQSSESASHDGSVTILPEKLMQMASSALSSACNLVGSLGKHGNEAPYPDSVTANMKMMEFQPVTALAADERDSILTNNPRHYESRNGMLQMPSQRFGMIANGAPLRSHTPGRDGSSVTYVARPQSTTTFLKSRSSASVVNSAFD